MAKFVYPFIFFVFLSAILGSMAINDYVARKNNQEPMFSMGTRVMLLREKPDTQTFDSKIVLDKLLTTPPLIAAE
ncbi:MAG: putative permease [Candidatus Omnitrophota bacterium]|jgi:predicted permease